MNNIFRIPEMNPLIFFDVDRVNLPQYFTKYMDKWMFAERLYDWQQPEDYTQIWQVNDIVHLQFESTYDPIVVNLLDSEGQIIITSAALIGLPDKFNPGSFSFEVEMSLAGVAQGCYRFQVIAGSGISQKTFLTGWQFISESQIRNSILIEYWSSAAYHKDVIFLTGIKMQFRVHGNIGFLEKARTDTFSRDQQWNPLLLNSKSAKQWPARFGDEFGLPDDIYNLLDNIFSCDNIYMDGKQFGVADGSKFEFVDINDSGSSAYPKRGVHIVLEEGLNRNSRIFAVDTDPEKKLMANIMVDGKEFGDLSNQGSSNAVPVNYWY